MDPHLRDHHHGRERATQAHSTRVNKPEDDEPTILERVEEAVGIVAK